MIDMEKAHIRIDGLFLNADAGFDCASLRSVLKAYGVVANILIRLKMPLMISLREVFLFLFCVSTIFLITCYCFSVRLIGQFAHNLFD